MKQIRIVKKVAKKDFRATVYFNAFLKNRWMPFLLAAMLAFALFHIVRTLQVGFQSAGFLFYSSLMIVILLGFLFVIAENTIKKILKANEELMGSNRKILLDDSGITTEGKEENSLTKYDWGEVVNAYEVKNYFFIFMNVRQTIIIPKEYGSTEEIEEISKGLYRHLGSKKFEKRCK